MLPFLLFGLVIDLPFAALGLALGVVIWIVGSPYWLSQTNFANRGDKTGEGSDADRTHPLFRPFYYGFYISDGLFVGIAACLCMLLDKN